MILPPTMVQPGLAWRKITHSFDELGNIYDAQGRIGAWWTAEDHSKYVDAAEKLVEQFNHYCPVPDLCVNGKQVLAEKHC